MDGLLFLVNMIAIGIVIHWCRSNDKVSILQRTTGLLGEIAFLAPKRKKRGGLEERQLAKSLGDRNSHKGR